MKASTETCFEAQKAIFQAIPDVKKATDCLMACDTSRGLGCVGPPDQAGCDCQMACYQAMPAAAQEKAKAAADCYEKAVGPACL